MKPSHSLWLHSKAEQLDWTTVHNNTLDLIVCTVGEGDLPFSDYLGLLRFDGAFVQVGAPDNGLPSFSPFPLLFRRIRITGSLIGSPRDIREMFELAAEKNIRPWVQTIPMKDANRAILDMTAGKPRYRYTLVNEE